MGYPAGQRSSALALSLSSQVSLLLPPGQDGPGLYYAQYSWGFQPTRTSPRPKQALPQQAPSQPMVQQRSNGKSSMSDLADASTRTADADRCADMAHTAEDAGMQYTDAERMHAQPMAMQSGPTSFGGDVGRFGRSMGAASASMSDGPMGNMDSMLGDDDMSAEPGGNGMETGRVSGGADAYDHDKGG